MRRFSLRYQFQTKGKAVDNEQTVLIVDDDEGVREGLGLLLESVGQPYRTYASAVEFLDAFDPDQSGCLVLDIRMPRMSGLELQRKLKELGCVLPIIFITGHGDIPMAVEAMRHGALDFIRKPFREQNVLDRINEALEYDAGHREELLSRKQSLEKVRSLTDREHAIFTRVAAGDMNKVIAADLGISERTVEVHRSGLMQKLGARTLAQLIRIKIEAEELAGSE